jgi:SpoVK/Ycf46/Vps4 family AAA+-type ATPase
MEQKKQLIMKNGLLEYYEPKVGMSEIGGMDLLKDWMSIRARAFGDEAKKFGIENPKGVLLVGIQGCGKSHMAKAIAHTLGVPLLRFDVGKVFSKTVGSSEENVRNVLALIDAVGDCVVMIDEIEKGLAGVQSSNQSDGGTTARVVGTLLSWMNDKTSSAFIVATANDVKQLPPELQRKGRFDELFFVPLPEVEERKTIYEIHITKRGRDASKYNTQLFAEMSDKFSGAECEEAVKSALIIAFNEGTEMEDRHVVKAVHELIPLFKTCEEDLTHLYNWVGWDDDKEDGIRARFASSARKKIAKSKGGNVISFKKSTKDKE